MNIFSKVHEKLVFKFSIRRLLKAMLLVILFGILGIFVHLFYQFENSDSGLKILYMKEISNIIDLQDKEAIKIIKQDITNDKKPDYVIIAGNEKRSGSNSFNSIVELYEKVVLYIIDGDDNSIIGYETNKDFGSDADFKIYDDESDKYIMICDFKSNVSLIKVKDNDLVDYVKNTTKNTFLGYTIYTEQTGNNIIVATLDNFGKSYLQEYKDKIIIDFNDLELNIKKYRETYLRDGFSRFELKDTNKDGILEFVGYQYILYSLEDNKTLNKTLGTVATIFEIKDEKFVFSKVTVEI